MPVKLENLTLYTLAELSKKLKVTTVSLRAYIKAGRLKGRKMGTRWYISEDALREYFEGKATERAEAGIDKKAKTQGTFK